VVSASGGVEFSAERTRDVIAEVPELAARAAERDGRVPVLRLVWPVGPDEPAVPQGFDTEVRLPLRSDVDGAALFAGFAGQAEDLLLSLTGLARVEIDGIGVWSHAEDQGRVELRGPSGTTSWLVCRQGGLLPEEATARLGVEARQRPEWTVTWAVPVGADGSPRPLDADVLHAPTPTDERMSLPARLIATLPIEPTRRRVAPGPAAEAVFSAAAQGYVELVTRLEPGRRTALVPRADFPLSEVDDTVRELVIGELRRARWLPAAGDGADLAPARATVLDLPGEELADLVAGVLPGVVDGELAGPEHAKALAVLGVSRMSTGALVAAVTGIDRPPAWWHRLYSALGPVAEVDATVRAELGGLPVPLVDGRTLPGPRGVLLVDEHIDRLSTVDGLRVVHPEAAHPLLERLGARRGGPADLLDSEPLRDAVERSLDDAESGVDVSGLVDVVLRLIGEVGEGRPWLGALALPDEVGDWRRADELALPGSAFLDVLAEDSPIGVLAEETAKAWPASVLTAAGVLDSFTVVDDEDATGPDHDLPGEADWWDALAEPPTRVLAIRDLDQVDDEAWPRALRLLAGEPGTWRALHHPHGHTAWWLGRNALLAGATPGEWRLPGAAELAGLYDPVPDLGLDEKLLTAIGVLGALDAADPEDLLDRLGDPDREVSPGVVLRAHAALAATDPDDVEPPEWVRTIDGQVHRAEDCVVLDAPWLLGVLQDGCVVSAGDDFLLAAPLAEVLDLPLASSTTESIVDNAGEFVSWAELGAVVAACDLLGVPVPAGGVLVHDELPGAQWWVDAAGVHVEDSAPALARALAWVTDTWPDRHTFAALIDEPEARTQLG
jgi:hypothetical protein